MVLEHMAGHIGSAVAGLGSAAYGMTTDSADLLNGTFGSIVAVTGDAHQAQVAQDIFRQEVRIERSWRVREDIRDAQQLMIENVQSQLLMGNLILGICFSALIEGSPSQFENTKVGVILVQELWAVCAFWSISLVFLAVWFALRYQEQVSVQSRKRLLEKHRITTPNDEVVGRLGGLSLAEKVAALHQRGLDEFASFLEHRTGCDGARDYLHARFSEMLEALPRVPVCDTGEPRHLSPVNFGKSRAGSNLSMTTGATKCTNGLTIKGRDMTFEDMIEPPLQVFFATKEEKRLPDDWEENSRQHIKHGNNDPRCIRINRGTRPWFDAKETMLDHYIVDLPDFLQDETMVRLPWEWHPQKKERHRKRHRSICFMVKGQATLYVSAQWPPRDHRDAFRGQGPPPNWKEEDMPSVVHLGMPRATPPWRARFERVEGFSLLVSEDKMDLPLYKIVLQEPDDSGWTTVQLRFRFEGSFVAPVLILRQGAITTCEEDWPVTEFMQELDAIQPYRDHSLTYMSHGLLNLLLAAFFSHLGRILTDRPWPECRYEVSFVVVALLPSVIITILASRVFMRMYHSDLKSHPRLRGMYARWMARKKEGGAEHSGGSKGSSGSPVVRPTPFGLDDVAIEDINNHASLKRVDSAESLDSLQTLRTTLSGHTAASPSRQCPVTPALGCWPQDGAAAAPTPPAELFAAEIPAERRYAPCCGADRGMPLGAGVGSLDGGGGGSSSSSRCLVGGCGTAPSAISNDQESFEVVVDSEQSNRRLPGYDPFKNNIDSLVEVAHSDSTDVEEGELALADDDPNSDHEDLPNKRCPSAWSVWTSHSALASSRQPRLCGQLSACCKKEWIEAWSLWRKRLTWIAAFQWVVLAFWIVSVPGLVIARAIHSGHQGGDHAVWTSDSGLAVLVPLCGALGGTWTREQVSWPTPFFVPTAAAAPWFASEWLLTSYAARASSGDGNSSDDETRRKLVRLPQAARGLFAVPGGSRLLVMSDHQIHVLDLSALSLEGSSALVSPLVPSLGVAAQLPRQLGRLVAVAAAVLPPEEPPAAAADGESVVFAMASEAGGVFLSAATNLTALLNDLGSTTLAELEVALPVPRRPAAGRALAVLLCGENCLATSAKQPVVFTADADGCLTAVGLQTGNLLGSWRWALAAGAEAAPIALSIDGPRLLLAGRCPVATAQQLFSAPLEALFVKPPSRC